MRKAKKILPIIFLIIFLVFIFWSFTFAQETEVKYPQVGGAETPTQVKTALPKYINYLFALSLAIAGLIAFASLVYGGFRYIASAGSPVAMSDAKSQITAGILGLVILLVSFLLLRTINPQLVVLKVGPKEFEKGVILYNSLNCQGGPSPIGEEGKEFLRVRRSLSSLEEFNGKTQSVYFYNPGEEMEVYIFPNDGGFKPGNDPSFGSKDHAAGQCKDTGNIQSRSIVLYWKIPGVYLFEKTNYETPPEARLFISNSAAFEGFHDKIKSLMILPLKKKFCDIGVDIETGTPISCKTATDCDINRECLITMDVAKFGVILHENSDFEGDCQVFFTDNTNLANALCTNSGNGPYCKEPVKERASAITIFKQRLFEIPTGKGVTLYANYDFNEEEGGKDWNGKGQCGPYAPTEPTWIETCQCSEVEPGDECKPVLENPGGPIGGPKGSSIRIEGSYIALLFREDGRCEVFKSPGDVRLNGNHIGDDQARYMLVIPISKEE